MLEFPRHGNSYVVSAVSVLAAPAVALEFQSFYLKEWLYRPALPDCALDISAW
jgi:hypothetical protein